MSIFRLSIMLFGLLTLAHLMPTYDPTPTPPVVLYRDDFSTRADRWRLFDLGKAAIAYDNANSDLRLSAKAAHYALWSVPDTELKPVAFDMRVQVAWITGDADAQFGLVIDYQSDTDMLVVTVAHDGTVRVGRYYFGVWQDLSAPVRLTLDNSTAPITLDIRFSTDHHLSIMAAGQAAQTLKLDHYKAGNFGLFALSGAQGGINVAFQNFTVSEPQ